jgi:hypothetical protein
MRHGFDDSRPSFKINRTVYLLSHTIWYYSQIVGEVKYGEPVAMLLLQHGDGPGGVGENCFTPEFDFGVVWIRGFDAVQAP